MNSLIGAKYIRINYKHRNIINTIDYYKVLPVLIDFRQDGTYIKYFDDKNIYYYFCIDTYIKTTTYKKYCNGCDINFINEINKVLRANKLHNILGKINENG